ncbi:MAG: ribosomal-processing cysteine protease Prp [Erysipelotrichaceae bacterium]
MVEVGIYAKDKVIHKIEITGHANYSSKGQDLVCAGVSSISVGILNALDQLADGSCTSLMNEGCVKIEVNKLNCEITQTILQVMLIQLRTVETSYRKYICIRELEV